MKIKNIQVDGFGVWKGLNVDALSQNVTVFYGQNEAGKTTLMQFVRSMMFGFSEERQNKYFPPLYGGDLGGSVHVTSPHGEHEIKRHCVSDRITDAADVTVTQLKDGTSLGQNQLTQMLSEIDESIFTNVFAIGLQEIQELNGLNSTDAAEMLYRLTSGMDRVSLLDVMRDLKNRREQILSSDSDKPSVLGKLRTHKRNLQNEINQLGNQTKRWFLLIDESKQIEKELQQLDEEQQTLHRHSRLLETAIQIAKPWRARIKLQSEITSLGHLPAEDTIQLQTLDEINGQGKELSKNISKVKQQRQEIKDDVQRLVFNPELWKHKNRIEALAEHTPWIESLQRQVNSLNLEITNIESNMSDQVVGLGNHLNIAENHVKSLEKQNLRQLKNSAKRLLRQQNQHRKLQSDIEDAEFELLQLQERLNIQTPTDSAHTSLEETSRLVAHLRQRVDLEKRIEKFQQAHLSLQRDIDEIVNEQALPVNKLITLGVIFVTGTVLAGFGLLDWMAEQAPGQGNTGLLLLILGAVCGFLSLGLKSHWERMAREALEDFRHQAASLKRQLKRAQTEQKATTHLLPNCTDFRIELSDAERRLARLESMAPVENQLQATLAKLQDLKRKEANQQHQVQSGTTQWQGQLRTTGLPDTLQPLQLKEILQRTGRITDTNTRLSALRSELENRNKELNTLRSQVSSLLHDCGLPTEESNILDLLKCIRESISEHRTLVNKKKELVNKHRSLGKQLSKLRDKLKDCRQKKQQLLSTAGATTEIDYREMATRLSRRENLAEQQEHLTTQISTALGPHFSEAEAAELLDQDQDDHCDKNWQHVQNKLKRNQEQQTELNQRFGESALEQKLLGENSRLDEARLELNTIESQIKEHQQQWRILATSSQMLESIRDEYEAKRQPETLQNASNYLQRLTDGKYQRIWTRMEGKQLLCDTNNNETLTVDKLSRGTREAVFLSLRLSLVDAYAKRGKTLPMVLDDVLVNFDSQRGDAAAKLLCDFSNRGHQVLIFTCHEHIAQLFHQRKASVKTLPHHSDVANAHTKTLDFSYNPTHNRTAPPTIPSNGNWSQIEIDNFDPELEFELAAVEQDERASQKLNQELVYYFNEENPAVKLTDLNIA